ncbi:RagB/SusD family nutrient uptake outer membrane protein [Chitinophaga sedimenti]|uniref:RagB/SusD family nutrient uptake outer membrane protein n=1 Tax=Chitinophaga sedimenti TaxID=2033606 RepID=UPI00249EC853|nr:RagB/SusD family nutrient uptake outer membrane protein [Chitinophaga sedimenti]
MIRNIVFALILAGAVASCKNDYLDIVPDNVATIENAFANRNEAEKYLFTCYSFLPQDNDIYENPAMLGGDEMWTYWPITNLSRLPVEPQNIARGNQGKVDPKLNFWDGAVSGKPLFRGIRECNIFLDNVDKVIDLDPSMKERWISEVKFLKAYYHFYLFRMYGPIPVIDVNLPIDATTEQVRVRRQHVDSVVNYMVNLLDVAAEGLPLEIQNRASELGRITKPIALALKAKVLVTAASPLYNGDADFSALKDKQNNTLFPTTASSQKWMRAAVACQAAIEACNRANIRLYTFDNILVNVNDSIRREMSIRNSVSERWNSEIIWGGTMGGSGIQQQALPRLDAARPGNEQTYGQIAPTMKMAEIFYSDKGVPISEDVTWNFGDRYALRTATAAEKNYVQEGYTTIGLHFNREPRFYANIAFDGGLWYMQNGTWKVQAKSGQLQSRKAAFGYSITGYFPKKLANWKFVIQDGQSYSLEQYAWPVIRLADLYLLYAEALNESAGPSADAYFYINEVRKRAGLKSVEESRVFLFQ